MAKWKLTFTALPTKHDGASRETLPVLATFERETSGLQATLDELCDRVFRFGKTAGMAAKPDTPRCACKLTLDDKDELRDVFNSQQFPVVAIAAAGDLFNCKSISEALNPAAETK